MGDRGEAKRLLDIRFSRMYRYMGIRYDGDDTDDTSAIVDALMGEPEPTPAPKLDTEKVRELIDAITNESFSSGFQSAECYHARRNNRAVVEDIYNELRIKAMDRCGDARADLLALLGIEEE